MSGTTDITQDLTNRISPLLNDELLMVNAETKAVQAVKVDTLRNFLAAFFSGAVIPQKINAGAVLGAPAEVQIYYAPAGSYTTPSGVVNLTGNLNMWFWNKAAWSYMEIPVSIDATSLAKVADIVNNLTAGGATKMLSAEQGKILNQSILDFVNEIVINSFTSPSKNKFNFADPDIARGKFIAGDGAFAGALQTNALYSVSGYQKIEVGQTLVCNKARVHANTGHNLYDENKVKIATVNNVNQVTATVKGYARFTILVTDVEDISLSAVQVEIGTVSTLVVPYGRNLKGSSLNDETVDLSKLSPSLKTLLATIPITYNKIVNNETVINSFTSPSKNKFNFADPDIIRGFYILGDGGSAGQFGANASYSITGFIPIQFGQTVHCNKSQVSAVIGINLYNTSKVWLTTQNNSANAVAASDGFVRFTISVAAAADISAAGVQIELGNVETAPIVPYGRVIDSTKIIPESIDGTKIIPGTLDGLKITTGTVSKTQLNTELNDIISAFVYKTTYDSATALISITGSKTVQSSLDISGWGATYNKTNISFNAIRLPYGISYNPAVADLRKWKYVQVCIKNTEGSSTFLAKSPLMDIGGLTTLPELVLPLMLPDLSAFTTLNDASFTGSTYFINIYFFNAAMSHAYGGTIIGTMSNYLASSSRYVTTNSVTSWAAFSGYPSLAFEHLLLTNVKRYEHLLELDAVVQEKIEISLPDKIYAIVGDTLQLYYRGVIKAVNPYNYDVVINCSKGAWYPRYFEYTPLIGDVGTVNFTVKVKNSSGVVIATKTCSLITKNVVASPSTPKRVLCIGDSNTANFVYASEFFRRLTGSGGTPAGKALTNIISVGHKMSGSVGVDATGGWSWGDHVTVGRKAFTYTVSGVTVQPTVGAIYNDANGKAYTMIREYSSTSLKLAVNDLVSNPPTSGVLTKISGTGDATINFSARVQSSGNAKWNDTTGMLDLTDFANAFCGGSLDIIYIMLTWNAQYGNRIDFTAFTNYAKTFFDHAKVAFPSIKIKLMGIQVSDLKGGVRVNGAPAENTYTDTYGLASTALNMNKSYQDLANDPIYSDYVEFVNVSSQVDSEYNMPYVQKAVNIRNSTVTEAIGTNDVHPNTDGYNQIADVVYRNFIANFCQ